MKNDANDNGKQSTGVTVPKPVPAEPPEGAFPPGQQTAAADGETHAPEATPPPTPTAPPESQKPAPSPEESVAALEAEKQEVRDRMLRIAAEFENYKKRSRREQGESETRGQEAVLRDLLEVIDNLERALAAFAENADPKGIQAGVALVLRQFQSKLERYEVRTIDAKGQPFDPRVHEAISRVPSTEVASGTVISELQKGYSIGQRLLRPATVVVAVAPPQEAPAASSAESAAASSPDAASDPVVVESDDGEPSGEG